MLKPAISVIITNYNYAGFVGQAIDSVLSQPIATEVIVVDDASSDNSRQILESYGNRIKTVFKSANLGHGDGFNQGFNLATGDIILFLDADDFMLPNLEETLIKRFDSSSALNVFRMKYADRSGKTSGIFPPLEAPMDSGDVTKKLLTKGSINTTVTSGMVFPRWALEKAMPVPVPQFQQGADGYLASVAPLYGPVKVHDIAITAYRQHSIQHSKFLLAYGKRARWCLDHNAARYSAIYDHAQRLELVLPKDLGAVDFDNVTQSLISLLFEPEMHPNKNETKKDVLNRLIALQKEKGSGFAGLVQMGWWQLFAHLPENQQKTLMIWRLDKTHRPKWLNWLGRFIRTTFKVTP
jgi:glycosyltransferase involved in cell wall biosynthesis